MLGIGRLLKAGGGVSGRMLKTGSFTPIAAGVALGLGMHHAAAGNARPDSPNSPGLFTTMKEGLLDFAMGDPYADVHMAGFPIGLRDILPIPHPFQALQDMVPNISDNLPFGVPDWASVPTMAVPDPVKNTGRMWDRGKFMEENPQYGGMAALSKRSMAMDRERTWYMNQATANVNRGYTTIDDDGLSSSLPYAPLARRTGSYASSSSTGVQADGSIVFGMWNLRQG